MVWGFLRDMGLLGFAAGGLALGLSRILHHHFSSPDIVLLATIGDVAMIGGACPTGAAMSIGYFVPAESP